MKHKGGEERGRYRNEKGRKKKKRKRKEDGLKLYTITITTTGKRRTGHGAVSNASFRFGFDL